MELHLANRTAIVTGGGGAICGAIARALAAEGASVAVWDLDQAAGEKVATADPRCRRPCRRSRM